MASSITRFDIKKLDGNIIQNHGGSKQVGFKQLGTKQVVFKQLGHKQVGFKQLGPGVETGVHGVQVCNGDVAVAQRRLKDKQLEKDKHELLGQGALKRYTWYRGGGKHYGDRSTWSRGCRGLMLLKKTVMESMEANLGKLLKCNAAWSTRWSPVRGFSIG
ncbi:hypothetical protein Tco_0484911 [Tanacetum coccineum]